MEATKRIIAKPLSLIQIMLKHTSIEGLIIMVTTTVFGWADLGFTVII